MSSRRNFFKKTALAAGAAAMPVSIVKSMGSEQPVSSATTTGKLPYKNTYIKNANNA